MFSQEDVGFFRFKSAGRAYTMASIGLVRPSGGVHLGWTLLSSPDMCSRRFRILLTRTSLFLLQAIITGGQTLYKVHNL